MAFDPRQFSISNIRAGSLLTDNALSPFAVANSTATPGRFLITASSSLGTSLLPLHTYGDVLLVDSTVLPDAAGGTSPINLLARSQDFVTAIFDDSLSELVLQPAPTNANNDPVDGQFTVSTEVTLVDVNDSGELRIRDASQSGRDNQLTLTLDGQTLVITESAAPFVTTVGTRVSDGEVRVPLAGLSSSTVVVILGAGNDLLDGSSLSDVLSLRVAGGRGNDTIQAGSGSDTLFGNSGNDHLEGGSGKDGLYGGGSSDTIDGGADDDSLFGGGGRRSAIRRRKRGHDQRRRRIGFRVRWCRQRPHQRRQRTGHSVWRRRERQPRWRPRSRPPQRNRPERHLQSGHRQRHTVRRAASSRTTSPSQP